MCLLFFLILSVSVSSLSHPLATDSRWVCVVVLIIGTAVYTVMGGLAAVIYTETLQTAVLLVGESLCVSE